MPKFPADALMRFCAIALFAVGLLALGACFPASSNIPPPTGPGLIKTLSGHSLTINDVAWSPNGKWIASASTDTTVRIWDAQSGDTVTVLQDFRGEVHNVAWSPDSKYLATGSSEPSNVLRIWDTHTWRTVFMTDPVPNTAKTSTNVTDIAWSPDSKSLAVSLATTTGSGVAYLEQIGTKSLVKIYNIPGGQNTATLAYPSIHGVSSVSWSPDGGRIAFTVVVSGAAWQEMGIVLWDLAKGDGPVTEENTTTLLRQDGMLSGVAWSPDGELIAYSSGDKTVRLWGVAEGKELTVIGAEDAAHGVAWSPDSSLLALNEAAKDGWVVSVRDAHTGDILAGFGHYLDAAGIAWSPDGKLLATASWDNSIYLWELSKGKEELAAQAVATPPAPALPAVVGLVKTLIGHIEWVHEVAWSPDGKWIASGGFDQRVYVWDAASGGVVTVLPFFDSVEGLAWSPDGTRLATVISTIEAYHVKVWDAQSWKLVNEWNPEGRATSVAWSPDGTQLAIGFLGAGGNRAEVWDVATGKMLVRLDHTSEVSAVAWSPDGTKFAATSSAFGQDESTDEVKIYDTPTWHEIAHFKHTDYIRTIAWSPNSKLLASASDDNTVQVWDVAKKSSAATMQHSGFVNGIAWSSDGSRLASSSNLSTLSIWDTSNWQILLTYTYEYGISGVSWAPDRKRIVTGGNDHVVKIWETK